MTILDAGSVASDQTSALFDIALAEILSFAEFPQPLSDLHDERLFQRYSRRQEIISRIGGGPHEDYRLVLEICIQMSNDSGMIVLFNLSRKLTARIQTFASACPRRPVSSS